MNKAHVTHLLSDFLEGALPQAGAEKVKAHLSFCNACRLALTETEQHIDTLKATPALRVPARLEARVLSAVHQEMESPTAAPSEEPSSSWAGWLTPFRGFALAATCAVVFLVVRKAPRDFRPAETAAPAPMKNAARERPAPESDAKKSAAKFEAEDGSLSALRKDANLDSVAANAGAPAAPAAPAAPEMKAKVETTSNLQTGARSDAPKPSADADAVSGVPLSRGDIAAAGKSRDIGAMADKPALRQAPAAFPIIGARSAIETPLEIVVNSQEEWEKLWVRHTAGIEPRPALPAVDFSTQQIIAIFAGIRPTGGFSVVMNEVANTTWNGDSARVVRYRVAGPPPGVMTTQVISHPFLLQLAPRFEGQTFFEKSPDGTETPR